MADNGTSKEDKLKFAQLFASRAADLDKYPDVISMGNDIGCCYLSLRNWAANDEDVAKIYQSGVYARASVYMDLANKAAINIAEFWEQPNLDMQGNIRLLTRERMTAVNRAKAQIEHWRWCAARLTPDLYGDYQYQLKEQDRKIAVMQQQLTDLINNRGK